MEELKRLGIDPTSENINQIIEEWITLKAEHRKSDLNEEVAKAVAESIRQVTNELLTISRELRDHSKFKVICPVCSGLGSVPISKIEKSVIWKVSTDTDDLKVCPACKGRGYFFDEKRAETAKDAMSILIDYVIDLLEGSKILVEHSLDPQETSRQGYRTQELSSNS